MTDAEARQVAAEWHGGIGSALYSFASTGAIHVQTMDAELDDVASYADVEEMEKLIQLLRYVYEKGERGPQPGWADVSF